MAYNIGKQPAIVVLPDNDVVLLFNDFTNHAVGAMTLKSSSTATTADFTSTAVSADFRMLMYARTHPRSVVSPVRIVPMVPNNNMSGTSISPLYEAINPTVQSISSTGSVVVSFWTNFSTATTTYDATKVIKFQHSLIGESGQVPETVYRAMCVMVVQFKRYYVSGGEVATTAGETPVTTATEDLVPIATKPHIIQMFENDYPITDFGGAGGGSGASGLRIHDHRDNFNGGFAFAVYHPGTGVPQVPWEV